MLVIDRESLVSVIRDITANISAVVAKEVMESIMRNNMIYTGNLLNSVSVEMEEYNKARVIVGKGLTYAKTLEYGLKPPFLDVEELVRWAMVKKHETYDEAEFSAVKVAKYISKHGVRERRFVKEAIENMLSKIGGENDRTR
jgi:hypothetical protein